MFFRFKKSTQIAALTNETLDSVQIVEGKVVVPKTLKIPGTDIECACYWMMTEAWKQPDRKKGRKMWMPQDSRQGCNGFFVEDGSGKVWVTDNADALELLGGWEHNGMLGKKGTQRYISRSVKPGDVVKIRGKVSKPKGAEPADCMVLRPDEDGIVTLLLKKKAK